MKKLLLIVCLFLLSIVSPAQIYIIGLKSTIQSDIITTKVNDDFSLNNKLDRSWNCATGIGYKYYYDEYSYYSTSLTGFAMDVLYSNQTEHWKGTDTTTMMDYNFSSLEAPIMVQFRSDDGWYGSYLNVGGSYSYAFKHIKGNDLNVKVNQHNLNVVLGIGFDTKIKDVLIIDIGSRGYYGVFRHVAEEKGHRLRLGFVVGIYYYWDFYHNNH